MTEKAKAFLRIEKLATGKIIGYEMWQEIPLDAKSVVIGRSSSSSSTPSHAVNIIGDDYITRTEHAEIIYDGTSSSYIVCDKKSMNGTFLNDQILEKNKTYPLKDRDIIGLAKIDGEIRVKLRFRVNDETPPPWADEESARISGKGLYINLASKKVLVNNHEVILTKTELRLLEVLFENKGDACSVDEIAWQVWGKAGASDELIAQHIRRLRLKIEVNPSDPKYIITIPGKHGCYRLDM